MSPWYALLAVPALTAWWAWDLYRRPWTRCWWCKGTGRTPGSTRRRFDDCKHCTRRGRRQTRRLRVGARFVRPELARARRRK